MRFIDPHIHMSARTTDDYERMAAAGVVAVIEPAFWLGQPRTNSGSYLDYLSSLVGWERFRAAQFGIHHYCAIGLNAKEANNAALAEEVIALLPRYLLKEGVVALGEIGYDDQTPAEDKCYRAQLDMAKELDMVVMVHTPHRDKKTGTITSMKVAEEHGLAPGRVIIDHNNEETVEEVLESRVLGGLSLCIRTPRWATSAWSRSRAAMVRSASSSTPVPIGVCPIRWRCQRPRSSCSSAASKRKTSIKSVMAMRWRPTVRAGQMKEADWLDPAPIDQRTLFEGNSVLRGQQARVDELQQMPDRLKDVVFK